MLIMRRRALDGVAHKGDEIDWCGKRVDRIFKMVAAQASESKVDDVRQLQVAVAKNAVLCCDRIAVVQAE